MAYSWKIAPVLVGAGLDKARRFAPPGDSPSVFSDAVRWVSLRLTSRALLMMPSNQPEGSRTG